MTTLFCSTIIPTVGRACLTRAVRSVLDQAFPDDAGEVIVVNDSGNPLSLADDSWLADRRVRVVTTQRRERCVARNTGAAMARGAYLHFLDDDDWLLPGAFAALWTLACEEPGRGLLTGAAQLVDRSNQPIIRLIPAFTGNCFLPAMAGEWIPLQASLVDTRLFFAIDGFKPHIEGAEDIDLLRRLTLRADIAATPATVASVAMGEEASTTDYDRHPARSRWAREAILDEPSAHARLRSSATSSAWHGRWARIYLTSIVWNVRRRRVRAAVGRAFCAVRCLVQSGAHVTSPAFWDALAHPYESDTFLQGFRAAQRPVERRRLRSPAT